MWVNWSKFKSLGVMKILYKITEHVAQHCCSILHKYLCIYVLVPRSRVTYTYRWSSPTHNIVCILDGVGVVESWMETGINSQNPCGRVSNRSWTQKYPWPIHSSSPHSVHCYELPLPALPGWSGLIHIKTTARHLYDVKLLIYYGYKVFFLHISNVILYWYRSNHKFLEKFKKIPKILKTPMLQKSRNTETEKLYWISMT